MRLFHRRMLLGAAAGSVSSLAAARWAAAAPMGDLRARAIAARAPDWLAAWNAQGDHRTGTGADRAAATWLIREAAAIGGTVGFEAFDVDVLHATDAFLELDGGVHILGEMLYDAPATGPDGVRGRIGPPGAAGVSIGVTPLPPSAVYSPGFAELRQRADLRGLVIVTEGGAPGLALLNAESFSTPYGPPCLQVTSFERARLAEAVAARRPARLVIARRRQPGNARNAVVRVAGSVAGLAPLVVVTPLSAWWRSTGERGGGLVCWLEALRALMERPPAREVLLLACSGHELGHLGLADFLARRPGIAERASWVYLGDNIGAAGGALWVQGDDAGLRARAAAALAGHGAHTVAAPDGAIPNGEAGVIARAGGRYVAVEGGNRLFHLPQDAWPGAVDVTAVSRAAAACAELVAGLAQRDRA